MNGHRQLFQLLNFPVRPGFSQLAMCAGLMALMEKAEGAKIAIRCVAFHPAPTASDEVLIEIKGLAFSVYNCDFYAMIVGFK